MGQLPDFANMIEILHVPYLLSETDTGRDDQRRRGILFSGAGSKLIEVCLRQTVRPFLEKIAMSGIGPIGNSPVEPS